MAHSQKGGALLIMGDGRVRADTEVELLGTRWTLADGPFTLAREAGVGMVAAVLRRVEEGKLALRFEEFPRGLEPEEGVRHYAGMLDRWVREAPEMWVRRWVMFLADVGASAAVSGRQLPESDGGTEH